VDLHGQPCVSAVLDWELSTLGDPLADLGTTMAYWHDEGDAERDRIPVAVGVTAWPGFPAATDTAGAAVPVLVARALKQLLTAAM
jgi:aminoglycoside phosphotransferase (APT) family kinase protein